MKGIISMLNGNISVSISDKARHKKMVSLVERMLELTPSYPPKWGDGMRHARRRIRNV